MGFVSDQWVWAEQSQKGGGGGTQWGSWKARKGGEQDSAQEGEGRRWVVRALATGSLCSWHVLCALSVCCGGPAAQPCIWFLSQPPGVGRAPQAGLRLWSPLTEAES